MRQEMDISRLHGQLYCQIESLNVTSDFSEVECVRFVGVERAQFSAEAFAEGIEAFVIDLPRDHVQLRTLFAYCDQPDDCRTCMAHLDRWWCVTFKQFDAAAQSEPGYVYRCFGENVFASVALESISVVKGFPAPGFPRFVRKDPSGSNGQWVCSSFSVGQGMASLVYDDAVAYLIDAGAGTPIRRVPYQTLGSSNELATRISGRDVTFVLSHGDEDHWRLLRWDPQLRGSIREFVIPAGRPRVAFFDKEVKPLVRELLVHEDLQLSGNAKLRLLRTNPRVKTSNNDGIVVVFEGKKHVLFPGDCVYSAMKRDCDTDIQALVKGPYDGVVVPHHGDYRSSMHIPAPTQKDVSKAFFAAGDHGRYNHPHPMSEKKHEDAGFDTIVNKTAVTIVEHMF